MDQIQETRERIRKALIKAVSKKVEQDLENYEEPQRAGIRKGEEIGFSKRKMMTAMLMVLHPNGLGLKQIGQISHASDAMIRYWRTEETFKKAVNFYCDLQANPLCDFLETEMQRVSDVDADLNLRLFIDTLPLYSDPIIKRIFATIRGHIDCEKDSSMRLHWLTLSNLISQAFSVRDDKSLKRFYRNPTNLEFWKAGIQMMIEGLTNPKIIKTLKPKELKKYRETLERSVFQLIDILAE